MHARLIAAVACTLLACGCGKADPPGSYRISVAEAYARLSKADFKDFMSNRQCGVLIHISTAPLPGNRISWRIESSQREMLTFTATLKAVDAEHTQVKLDVNKEADGKEAYDGTQFYRRPAVKQPVRPAIDEQIDAILTGRKFAWQNLERPGVPRIRDSVCDVQRARLEEMGEPFSVDDTDR